MTRSTICGVLEALDTLAGAGDPHQAAQAVVGAVRCATRSDGVLVTSLRAGEPVSQWTWPPDFLTEAQQATLETVTATHPYPLISHTRSGPGWVLRLSDILTGAEYRATPLYTALLKELSVPRQLAFSVPTVTGRSLCVALGRSGSDFTDTECDRLNALRGPLGTAARRHQPQPPPASSDEQTSSLTGREHQILQLAATGLSDTQVGRRLGITPRTVSKHLENVYRKTRTSNRTEASAQLYFAHLPRPAPSDAFSA